MQDIAQMQAVLEFEAKRGSDFEKNKGSSGSSRPAVEDLKRFSNKLEEEIRQKEVFKDVVGGGGRVKALRGIVGNPTTPSKGGKKLDSLSPLGSRKMKEVDMNVVPKFGRKDQGVLGGGGGKSHCSSKMRADLNADEDDDVIIGPSGGVGTSTTSSSSNGGGGGRKRAQLKTMVATGKFEEGLEIDDMKFFS